MLEDGLLGDLYNYFEVSAKNSPQVIAKDINFEMK